jgi:hypothetical protein
MSDPPELPPSTDYEVGYGKPPKASRFKKGQSGNPSGRPKGAKNKAPKNLKKMRDLVITEAYREVRVQDKDGPISMPVMQAALRALALKAAQGHVSAHRHLADILARAEKDALDERLETFDKAVAYKKQKLAEIRDYEARGETAPQMLPHPDDIEIDYETGEVVFHGPVNEDDLAIWGQLHGLIEQLEAEIQTLKENLESLADDDAMSDQITNEIEDNQFFITTACLSIARRWNLPSHKVFRPSVSFDELSRHLRNGTDPTPPKRLKKIVESRRSE